MIIGVMVAMHDSIKCIYVVASPACATSTWCKAYIHGESLGRNKAMCMTSGKMKYRGM